MPCSEALRTQSYFDRALEANELREAEAHIQGCAECAKLLRDLETMHRAMRESASYHRASPALRARVAAALDSEKSASAPWFAFRSRPFWTGAVSGALSAAAAAAIALMVLLPSDADEVLADVTAAHMRSLVGTHLVDVASNDADTVKPWLMHHAGIAPPVADFSGKGFRLIGGRADFVYEGGAGVTVYRHGTHVVNVFAWTAKEDEDLPESASNDGINVVFWKKDGVIYCAVSDLSVEQLKSFTDMVRATPV